MRLRTINLTSIRLSKLRSKRSRLTNGRVNRKMTNQTLQLLTAHHFLCKVGCLFALLLLLVLM